MFLTYLPTLAEPKVWILFTVNKQ